MPYIVTEPIKIPGTKLGYAVYPFQIHYMDKQNKNEVSPLKLYIFELKDSNFIEIERTLYQKDIPLSMQNAKILDKTLKEFIINNEEYVTNVDRMDEFFADKTKKR